LTGNCAKIDEKMPILKIARIVQFGPRCAVLLDNVKVGELGGGEEMSTNVSAGSHLLSVRLGLYRSPAFEFYVVDRALTRVEFDLPDALRPRDWARVLLGPFGLIPYVQWRMRAATGPACSR
jgi:hypothetical protein